MYSVLRISLMASLLLLSSCSCAPFFCNSNESFDVPEAPDVDVPDPVLSIHAEEITGIIQTYATELRHLKRLHLEHAHTYYNDAGIHTIQLEFISQDIIELCQARRLIIDVTEGLLGELNSNCLLIPEFSNHAFYPFNMEIYIKFESFFIRYVDPFYIKWITLEDAKITFYTGDATDIEKNSWHAKKESYDTSRNIVFYQRMAEDNFKAMNEPNRAIFGDKRFYSSQPDRPPKFLE